MSDEEIHDALVKRLLPEYEESLRRLAESSRRQAALSDDEWWERTVGRHAAANPRLAEQVASQREAMIRQRHAFVTAREGITPEALAHSRAQELLPALQKIRRFRRAKGAITDNQYHAACMASSLAQISAMRKKLKEAAKRTADPRRKRIIEMLAGNVFTDLKSLRSLARPDVTEERLEDVAKGIGARFEVMTLSMEQGHDEPVA